MASESFVPVMLTIIKVLTYVYEFITWPIYFLTRRSGGNSAGEKEGAGRIRALPTREGDFSSPWRAVEAMDELNTVMYPGCTTLDDLWRRASSLWPNKDCLGTRELKKTEFEVQPNGRKFKKVTLGAYIWETYEQCDKRIAAFGSGLYALGFEANDHVVIFAETRAEWLLAAQSCFRYKMPVVTLYATLGDDALVHGVNEAEAKVLVTSDELLPKVVKLHSRLPNVKHIIYMNNGVFSHSITKAGLKAELDTLLDNKPVPEGLTVMSMVEVEEIGRDPETIIDPRKLGCKPQPDDLAVIMYTSGSTGVPKGVEILHKNLVCAVTGQYGRLSMLTDQDVIIAYLPLAHVLELCCEIVGTAVGVRIGYSNPQTLTDTSSKIKKGTKGDVTVLKPTLMACVPTILDRISKSVWEKLGEGGLLYTELFKWAYEYKAQRMNKGYRSILLDKLVFRKIRKLLGKRLRYMLSGGAPLSAEAQKFVNVCFCKMVQGYGLTETCGAGTVMTMDDLRPSQVGAPLSCLQIKLRPWTEGGYSPDDKPRPRGEVLIGGDCITRGYFKQPEKTKEDFFTDENGVRWFCTGDIGVFHYDGTLSIVDRKKDLVKLSAGEYVSLGKVEIALSVNALVETLCIYGDSLKSNVIGIMVPNKKQLINLASSIGVDDTDIESLCQNEKVRNAALKELQKFGLEKRLERFEIPFKILLTPGPWTPDTGLVTDALKLKRKAIQERFQDEIDRMYS